MINSILVIQTNHYQFQNYQTFKIMVRAAGPIGLILNIGWLIFGGIATAILWLLGALALAATIIGIPFAIQALKLAKLSLAVCEILKD